MTNPPKPNDRISEYILLELIGTGTFGQVFKARHHVWPDKIVAIKIPSDPQYVRMLRREGVAMHQVRHPNVIRPIGFDPFADPPYLVMEFVGGGDLRRLLAHGPLPIERAVGLLEQVLAGLEAAHAAGLLHLDLKPSNILLAEDGTAKLTDFGLGRALLLPAESVAQSLSLSADAQAITGTVDYMSPEQRRADPERGSPVAQSRDRGPRPVDQRADLYAVGVILFEMLTGERPAGGERPSELRKEVPPWLDELFVRSYARLERRYPTAGAMLADLRAGRQAAGAMPVAVPPPIPGAILGPAPGQGPGVGQAIPVIHGPPPPLRGCPACGRPARADDQFCIGCGQRLAAEIRRCKRCGGFPQRDDKFCVLCGATL